MLCGWLFGGLLAYDLAVTLAAAGVGVRSLVLVEPPEPGELGKTAVARAPRRGDAEHAEAARRVAATATALSAAGHAYRWRAYDGDVTVVLAADERTRGRDALWRDRTAGRARLVEMPGAHDAIVTPEGAAWLAGLLVEGAGLLVEGGAHG